MHRAALPALLSAALAVFVIVSGCTASTDIQGTPLAGSGDNGTAAAGDDASVGGGSSSSSSGGGCVAQRPPNLSPSSLPSCCTDGAAHCVPTQYVPPGDIAALAQCTGGYCVPDPFITNPDYIPPSCTAFNGTPGACLSLCVPQVSQYKSILTQATCAATELCAPCTNPLTQQASGACAFKPPTTCADGGDGTGSSSGGSSSGGPTGDGGAPPAACPHTGPPVLDPSTLPACGTAGGAHCLQSALVPANLQAQLATCPGGYCVPDTFIEAGGNFIPPTCTSLDGAEGRCLNVAIPQVASEASQLTQDTCATYEKCVPCYSPIDGKKTGSCNLSCDPGPTKPVVLFPSCCSEKGTDEGRCIPSTIVPSAEQNNLSQDSCQAQTDLCVPSEMLNIATFKPPACSATGFLVGNYTGVCLSKCLSFGIQGIALAQGNCDGIHTCAPCTNPLSGKPTGAPGCP
jgi:hypothetical protein